MGLDGGIPLDQSICTTSVQPSDSNSADAVSKSFETFDFSVQSMDEIINMFAMPTPSFTHDLISQDAQYNFHQAFQDPGFLFGNGGPHHTNVEPALPPFQDAVTPYATTLPPAPSSQALDIPSAAVSPPPMSAPVTTSGQLDDAPCRTTRRHVPSTREQVLNAIGSSSARIGATLGEGKENEQLAIRPAMKRKAKPSSVQSNK
jgi:hypothetical protein